MSVKNVYFTEAKLQVLANLANFAYDPINYEYIRHLKIIDLFLGKNYGIKCYRKVYACVAIF